MIIVVLIVGWVALIVVALALVGGSRHTTPRETMPPILRTTTRSELDRA